MSRRLLQISLIVVLTGIFYLPSLQNGFVWDDDQYLHANQAVQSDDGLTRIWFSHEMPQYYPLVFTSFWVEHQLWGIEPFGYHAVNLGLHIANALLVFLLLEALCPSLALAVGLLFALHPVQVETVAWISERKNLLGCLFYLLAIRCYLNFQAGAGRRQYLLSLGAFSLALLSKSITATFVVVPLLLKWWKREPIKKADLVAIAPFAGLGLLCGLQTVYLELYRVGASGDAWRLTLAEHLVLPGQIVWFYLAKLLFPVELVFIYPKWILDAGSPWQWLPTLALVVLGVSLYRRRDSLGRGAFATYLGYLAALFPALGFFNVYPMRFSYVANHFQYIASIGAFIFFAGLVEGSCARLAMRLEWFAKPRVRTGLAAIILCGVSLVYGVKILDYSRVFASEATLWEDVVAKNPASSMAHNNLGYLYKKQGDMQAAIGRFKTAIATDPGNALAYNNLGLSYGLLGRREESRAAFEDALRIDPEFASAYNNLGLLYLNAGDVARGFDYFSRASTLAPSMLEAHYNLAECHLLQGQPGAAVEALQRALALQPRHSMILRKLASAYALTGQVERAAALRQQADQLDPPGRLP